MYKIHEISFVELTKSHLESLHAELSTRIQSGKDSTSDSNSPLSSTPTTTQTIKPKSYLHRIKEQLLQVFHDFQWSPLTEAPPSTSSTPQDPLSFEPTTSRLEFSYAPISRLVFLFSDCPCDINELCSSLDVFSTNQKAGGDAMSGLGHALTTTTINPQSKCVQSVNSIFSGLSAGFLGQETAFFWVDTSKNDFSVFGKSCQVWNAKSLESVFDSSQRSNHLQQCFFGHALLSSTLSSFGGCLLPISKILNFRVEIENPETQQLEKFFSQKLLNLSKLLEISSSTSTATTFTVEKIRSHITKIFSNFHFGSLELTNGEIQICAERNSGDFLITENFHFEIIGFVPKRKFMKIEHFASTHPITCCFNPLTIYSHFPTSNNYYYYFNFLEILEKNSEFDLILKMDAQLFLTTEKNAEEISFSVFPLRPEFNQDFISQATTRSEFQFSSSSQKVDSQVSGSGSGSGKKSDCVKDLAKCFFFETELKFSKERSEKQSVGDDSDSMVEFSGDVLKGQNSMRENLLTNKTAFLELLKTKQKEKSDLRTETEFSGERNSFLEFEQISPKNYQSLPPELTQERILKILLVDYGHALWGPALAAATAALSRNTEAQEKSVSVMDFITKSLPSAIAHLTGRILANGEMGDDEATAAKQAIEIISNYCKTEILKTSKKLKKEYRAKTMLDDSMIERKSREFQLQFLLRLALSSASASAFSAPTSGGVGVGSGSGVPLLPDSEISEISEFIKPISYILSLKLKGDGLVRYVDDVLVELFGTKLPHDLCKLCDHLEISIPPKLHSIVVKALENASASAAPTQPPSKKAKWSERFSDSENSDNENTEKHLKRQKASNETSPSESSASSSHHSSATSPTPADEQNQQKLQIPTPKNKIEKPLHALDVVNLAKLKKKSEREKEEEKRRRTNVGGEGASSKPIKSSFVELLTRKSAAPSGQQKTVAVAEIISAPLPPPPPPRSERSAREKEKSKKGLSTHEHAVLVEKQREMIKKVDLKLSGSTSKLCQNFKFSVQQTTVLQRLPKKPKAQPTKPKILLKEIEHKSFASKLSDDEEDGSDSEKAKEKVGVVLPKAPQATTTTSEIQNSDDSQIGTTKRKRVQLPPPDFPRPIPERKKTTGPPPPPPGSFFSSAVVKKSVPPQQTETTALPPPSVTNSTAAEEGQSQLTSGAPLPPQPTPRARERPRPAMAASFSSFLKQSKQKTKENGDKMDE